MTTEQAERLRALVVDVEVSLAVFAKADISPSGYIINRSTGAVMTAEQARSAWEQAHNTIDAYIDGLVTP